MELYRKGGFKDTLIGSIKMPKLSLELDNRPHEQWYPLRAPSKKGAFTWLAPPALRRASFF